MTTLILVRHGESAANGKGCFAGQLDIPLSERGREQAVRTADYIAKTYSVDKIYSSDLSRAYDTAKPIAKAFGLEIIKDKNLREICSGDWQGLSFDELQEKYADSYGVWLKDIGNAVCPNGETVKNPFRAGISGD
ncbi:MAG: histidine phosphatase family protein [Clostridia bacterium]|nr:histidine phosphatase family protein [Clostridia bacterium]